MLAEKDCPAHFGCARSFGAQHVPDGGRRHRPADRLRQAQERRQSAADDEVSYGVGTIYSGKVGIYNPKVITQRRQLQGRVRSQNGNSSASSTSSTIHAGLRGARRGGKVNDIEPGKKLLLECKKAGMRIYPTNEAFAQGLKSEELASA